MKLLSEKNIKAKPLILALAGLLGIAGLSNVFAADANNDQPQEMQLQSDVQGQRSKPKVLFILPWEDTLETRDIEIDDSLISEEDFLAPVDRTVFQRQLNLYKQLEITQ